MDERAGKVPLRLDDGSEAWVDPLLHEQLVPSVEGADAVLSSRVLDNSNRFLHSSYTIMRQRGPLDPHAAATLQKQTRRRAESLPRKPMRIVEQKERRREYLAQAGRKEPA